jgi:2-polyprenyl-3-methyl-5-hydroxy-6-metoxy-1,4-benzoquinol methylase
LVLGAQVLTEDFPEKALQILANDQDHFWFVHRNRIVARMIQATGQSKARNMRILDLGCGVGTIAHYLAEKGYFVVASDGYHSAKALLNPRLKDSFFVFDLLNHQVPEDQVGRYDLVVLGDVIEHFENPVGVLKKAREFLKKDGRIIITVPALRFLWTDYDVQSGHKKRYYRGTLCSELKGAGFVVEKTAYFMLIPALILFLQRKLSWVLKSKDKDYTEVLKINQAGNLFMKTVMKMEYLVSQIVTLPFGSSLIGVGVVGHEN